MLLIQSSTGFLLFLLLNGLMLHNIYAGIGLKPLDFFRLSDEGKKVTLVFHPDEGLRLREKFQKKYGTKGEELIKSFGEGLTQASDYAKSGS